MKTFKLIGMALITILLPLTFSACGGDDEKDEPAPPQTNDATVLENNLTVSPTTLQLISDKGSSVSFSITTNSDWTISGCPEWLSLSAMAGSMNGSVTATALSSNSSATERVAELTVRAGNKSTTVTIRQLASLISDCTVGFKDILPMTQSVAFKYNIGNNVSYFYAAYLSKSAVGWTDEKIVNELINEDRFDPNDSEDTGLNGFGGMSPNTEYYLCAVGFNEKGERGELTKTLIKTLKYETGVPTIDIYGRGADTYTWYWTTEPDPYTAKYYMGFWQGDVADFVELYLTEAEIAWIMKDNISNGNMSPIATGGDWHADREPNAMSLYVVTWGVNAENAFSPLLMKFYGTLKQNQAQNRRKDTTSAKRSLGLSNDLINRLQSTIKTPIEP